MPQEFEPITVKVCVFCGKRFHPKRSDGVNTERWRARKYCSRKCHRDYLASTVPKVTCLVCGKQFPKGPSSNANKFCSRHCHHEYLRSGRDNERLRHNLRLTPEAIQKWRQSMEGRRAWNKGVKLSDLHRKHLSEAHLLSDKQRGERHPRWRGGLGNENYQLRHSFIYRQWRLSVFKRDDFTCQRCGVRGCFIEAHHLKSFCKHPELRFDVNNGVTLCVPCHARLDVYRKQTLCRTLSQ